MQNKIMQEEKRMALSRLNTRLGLNNYQSKEMDNFDAGIESTNYDFDPSTRTERLENNELQKSKLRQNLLKLFGDDDESTGIAFSSISSDADDIKFFNMNFNKIYTDLNNLIDLDYLNGDYLLNFFERYKLKYNDEKFGIDLFNDKDEERQIIQVSPATIQQTPNTPATPANPPTPGQPTSAVPQTRDEELENLLNEYLSVKHTGQEFSDVISVLEYLLISTNNIYNKDGSVKMASARSRLNNVLEVLKQYKSRKMTTKQINTARAKLNEIVKYQMDNQQAFEEYMIELLYRLANVIEKEYNNKPSQQLDLSEFDNKCTANGYRFVGQNDFSNDWPEEKDIFIDDKADGMIYVVETVNESLGIYLAHQINPNTFKMLKGGRITVFYDDTNIFEDERPPQEIMNAPSPPALSPSNSNNNLAGMTQQSASPINVPLPDTPPPSPPASPTQTGTGLRKRKNNYSKTELNKVEGLLNKLGYRIKK